MVCRRSSWWTRPLSLGLCFPICEGRVWKGGIVPEDLQVQTPVLQMQPRFFLKLHGTHGHGLPATSLPADCGFQHERNRAGRKSRKTCPRVGELYLGRLPFFMFSCLFWTPMAAPPEVPDQVRGSLEPPENGSWVCEIEPWASARETEPQLPLFQLFSSGSGGRPQGSWLARGPGALPSPLESGHMALGESPLTLFCEGPDVQVRSRRPPERCRGT